MPQILACYRDSDNGILVRQIVESLRETMKSWQVIEADEGRHYTPLKSGDAALVLIGQSWLTNTQRPGQSGEADAGVQRVIDEAFLTPGVTILPILLNGIVLPSDIEMPAHLKALVQKQPFVCHSDSYEADIHRLIQVLRVRTPTRSRIPLLWLGLIAAVIVLGGSVIIVLRSQTFKSLVSNVNQAVERLDTERPGVYVEQGWSAYSAGNYPQAVDYFQRAINLQSNYVEAFDGLGWSYYGLNEFDKAEESFTRQIELAPFATKSYIERGYFYRNIGDSAAAIRDFEQVLAQIPNNKDVYLTLAVSYQAIGNHEKATQAFERVTQLDPSSADAYYGMGISYDALARLQQALESFQRYLELTGDPDPTIVQRVEELKQETR